MQIEISRIDKRAKLPQYYTGGAACFDLATIEDSEIKPREVAKLRTGLVIKTPPGYFLAIIPRSSTHKLGLDAPNSIGVLDPDYSGPEDEIRLIFRNFTDETVRVSAGQRLAQGCLIQTPKVEWKEVDAKELGENSRGGIGSTGK